jgi:hypothetical protein
MASISADVSRNAGEEGGNNVCVEQEMVVDPAQNGTGSAPAADSAANIPEARTGPEVSSRNIQKKRYVTSPRPRIMQGAATVRVTPLPRLAGAGTTDFVRTTDRQRTGRGQ